MKKQNGLERCGGVYRQSNSNTCFVCPSLLVRIVDASSGSTVPTEWASFSMGLSLVSGSVCGSPHSNFCDIV